MSHCTVCLLNAYTCIYMQLYSVHVRMYLIVYTVLYYNTVVESALQLVSVAKETKGDSHNHEGGCRVRESAGWLVTGLRDLKELAEDAHSESGLIAGKWSISSRQKWSVLLLCNTYT